MVSGLYEAQVAAGLLAGDAAQRAVLPALDRVVDGLQGGAAPGRLARLWRRGRASQESPRGVYLWGGVGRGKSMLMDLVMQAAPLAAKRRVHFHAFMQEVQAALHEARRAGLPDAVRPVAEAIARDARLLCLDEVEIIDIADAMIIGRLVQTLFEKGVTLVATANRAPEDLYHDGLNRALFLPFIELIGQRMEVVELRGPGDYRQQGAGTGGRWLTPLDAATRAAMDALWAQLTGGAEEVPLRLIVHGRALTMGRACGRLARAGFAELCDAPFGAADYLALAASVDLLMIDDIPCMGIENANATRRFIVLVDALYEARVRLIASAADLPDRLCPEGEDAFAFRRTASRLAEMQGEGWGR